MANFDEAKYIKLDDSVLDSVAGGEGSGSEGSLAVCANCLERAASIDTSSGQNVFVCSSCGKKYYIAIDGNIVFLK